MDDGNTDAGQGENTPPENENLERILKLCMDAPGYTLFVGVLQAAPGGVINLNFDYRRYHMNLEDLRTVFENIARVLIDEGMDPEQVIKRMKNAPHN